MSRTSFDDHAPCTAFFRLITPQQLPPLPPAPLTLLAAASMPQKICGCITGARLLALLYFFGQSCASDTFFGEIGGGGQSLIVLSEGCVAPLFDSFPMRDDLLSDSLLTVTLREGAASPDFCSALYFYFMGLVILHPYFYVASFQDHETLKKILLASPAFIGRFKTWTKDELLPHFRDYFEVLNAGLPTFFQTRRSLFQEEMLENYLGFLQAYLVTLLSNAIAVFKRDIIAHRVAETWIRYRAKTAKTMIVFMDEVNNKLGESVRVMSAVMFTWRDLDILESQLQALCLLLQPYCPQLLQDKPAVILALYNALLGILSVLNNQRDTYCALVDDLWEWRDATPERPKAPTPQSTTVSTRSLLSDSMRLLSATSLAAPSVIVAAATTTSSAIAAAAAATTYYWPFGTPRKTV
jgi:hypothetical protein